MTMSGYAFVVSRDRRLTETRNRTAAGCIVIKIDISIAASMPLLVISITKLLFFRQGTVSSVWIEDVSVGLGVFDMAAIFLDFFLIFDGQC